MIPGIVASRKRGPVLPESTLTFDPSAGGAASWTLTDGNKTAAISSAVNAYVFTPIFKSSGKWFTVIRVVDWAALSDNKGYVVCSNVGAPPDAYAIGGVGGVLFLANITGTLPTFDPGTDINIDLHIAIDIDGKKGWVGAGSLPGDPAAGTGNNLSWTGTYNMGIAGYSNNNGATSIKLHLPFILPSPAPAGFSVLQ